MGGWLLPAAGFSQSHADPMQPARKSFGPQGRKEKPRGSKFGRMETRKPVAKS
jgi:hypothetical protein